MKNERNLLKLLTDDECAIAFREALDNANKHIESSSLIACSGQYGMAISHLILSTEETVKGLLLYLQSIKVEIRNVPGMYLYFTDHTIRHQLAMQINLMYGIIKPFMELALSMKDCLHQPDKKISLKETTLVVMSQYEKKADAYVKELEEMFDWWEDTNEMKNKGLYVDYTTRLETPMQIEEAKYLKSSKLILDFENKVFEIISYLEKLNKEQKIEFAYLANANNLQSIFQKFTEARKTQRKQEINN